MYQDFYGLRELPFELTPNPKFLYFTPGNREALSNLEYGLATAKAVTLLIGRAGTGKTTLLAAALESDRCRHVRSVYLRNPTLTRAEFVESLAHQFKLSDAAIQSKAALIDELEPALRQRSAQGEMTALVIDEAQRLSDELLEEVRLLANIETPTQKLISLVLAGQPELGSRLNEPGLQQLKQRVALRCEVSTFNLEQTASYIASRIRTAGGEAARMFSREAVMLIHDVSHGVARTINVMCDNALLSGFAVGQRIVDRAIVLEICRDFDLPSRQSAPTPDAEFIQTVAASVVTEIADSATAVADTTDTNSRTIRVPVRRIFSVFGPRTG